MKFKLIAVGVLLSTVCVSFAAEPEVDFSDVPTMHDIQKHMERVVGLCEEKCSFVDDVTKACFSTCLRKESERSESYFLRRYTASCQGRPFNEQFNFKPNDREKCEELQGSIAALDIMRRFQDVRQCVAAKTNEQNRRILSATRIAESQQRDAREKHPVITAAVDVVHKIRRQSK
ncbi:hypothetical protein ACFLXW_00305 [Candidatus Dependentiae bacterium]